MAAFFYKDYVLFHNITNMHVEIACRTFQIIKDHVRILLVSVLPIISYGLWGTETKNYKIGKSVK